jgi:hypothetical protein
MAAIEQLKDRLLRLPPEMSPWQTLKLDAEQPTQEGLYYVVYVGQATVESHHEVQVQDQDGKPLAGIQVLFGFDSGRRYPAPALDYWGKFGAFVGNMVETNGAGEARHTFHHGGEDIFIVDYQVDENGIQYIARASDVLWDCSSVPNPPGRFDHTGVRVVFRRYTPGQETHAVVHQDIEVRLKALEKILGM